MDLLAWTLVALSLDLKPSALICLDLAASSLSNSRSPSIGGIRSDKDWWGLYI